MAAGLSAPLHHVAEGGQGLGQEGPDLVPPDRVGLSQGAPGDDQGDPPGGVHVSSPGGRPPGPRGRPAPGGPVPGWTRPGRCVLGCRSPRNAPGVAQGTSSPSLRALGGEAASRARRRADSRSGQILWVPATTTSFPRSPGEPRHPVPRAVDVHQFPVPGQGVGACEKHLRRQFLRQSGGSVLRAEVRVPVVDHPAAPFLQEPGQVQLPDGDAPGDPHGGTRGNQREDQGAGLFLRCGQRSGEALLPEMATHRLRQGQAGGGAGCVVGVHGGSFRPLDTGLGSVCADYTVPGSSRERSS